MSSRPRFAGFRCTAALIAVIVVVHLLLPAIHVCPRDGHGHVPGHDHHCGQPDTCRQAHGQGGAAWTEGPAREVHSAACPVCLAIASEFSGRTTWAPVTHPITRVTIRSWTPSLVPPARGPETASESPRGPPLVRPV